MLHSLSRLCDSIRMPRSVTEEILSTAPILDLASLQPAMDCLFVQSSWEDGLARLKAQLGDDPRGIKVLTCQLLCALRTEEDFRRRQIPERVFLDTMDCFPRFVKEHLETFGVYGFDREWWTVRQLSGLLFRVELLEFELSEGKVCLHIPTGARLDPTAVDASLEAGRAFLAAHYPAWSGLPMVCHSWLLSPTLKQLLDPRSNIRRFQDRFRITPAGDDNRDYLVWIFKRGDLPPRQLPENTSLQRSLKAHLCAGGTYIDARGVLL